jgi:hypothetical protein
MGEKQIAFDLSPKRLNEGGGILKLRLYKLLCLICIFTLLSSVLPMRTYADEISGKTASAYGYALNSEMFNHGIMSTEYAGAAVENYANGGIYPAGVIYADIINFDNNNRPYLVIFRADPENACVLVNVYGYDENSGSAIDVVTLVKGYSSLPDVTGQLCLAFNDENRYIVYNEYCGSEKVLSEYYTIMDNTAFRYLNPPSLAEETGIVSFNCFALLPEVDISNYNKPLDDFFSNLKNAAANSVTYEDISENVSEDEETKIETVLTRAANFNYLEIGFYSTLEEYNAELQKPDTDNTFYLITNLYDLGEEIYYVRFATNHSFYNYALLRRTDKLDEGYQLLAVRTDSIPLSDVELETIKDVYMTNKLLMKKSSRGGITQTEKGFHMPKLSIQKPIELSKPIEPFMKKSAALIGGGICLVLFVILWIYMASDDE